MRRDKVGKYAGGFLMIKIICNDFSIPLTVTTTPPHQKQYNNGGSWILGDWFEEIRFLIAGSNPTIIGVQIFPSILAQKIQCFMPSDWPSLRYHSSSIIFYDMSIYIWLIHTIERYLKSQYHMSRSWQSWGEFRYIPKYWDGRHVFWRGILW